MAGRLGEAGLEGLSDALRLEMTSMGMHVSVIEPGLIATDMGGKLMRDTETWLHSLPAEGQQRYGSWMKGMSASVGRESANGSPPDVVARAVAHALTSRRPRTRYAVGAGAKRILTLRRILPDRVMDRMLSRALGLTS